MDCILGRYTAGSVMTAIFGILNGGMQLGQSSMYIEAVNTARAAAVTIYQVTCITYLHIYYTSFYINNQHIHHLAGDRPAAGD